MEDLAKVTGAAIERAITLGHTVLIVGQASRGWIETGCVERAGAVVLWIATARATITTQKTWTLQTLPGCGTAIGVLPTGIADLFDVGATEPARKAYGLLADMIFCRTAFLCIGAAIDTQADVGRQGHTDAITRRGAGRVVTRRATNCNTHSRGHVEGVANAGLSAGTILQTVARIAILGAGTPGNTGLVAHIHEASNRRGTDEAWTNTGVVGATLETKARAVAVEIIRTEGILATRIVTGAGLRAISGARPTFAFINADLAESAIDVASTDLANAQGRRDWRTTGCIPPCCGSSLTYPARSSSTRANAAGCGSTSPSGRSAPGGKAAACTTLYGGITATGTARARVLEGTAVNKENGVVDV